ncbi:MAG TPA: putative lipid II flippase FtsW [Thermoanaerobaculia bacterium]|nr:putative lipid II flippase FtsW [Thermoanaerobaculia bacterium]
MSRKLTYDTWLFGAAMFIVVVGIVMIYSASAIIATQRFGASTPYYFMTRQLVWLGVGGIAMILIMHLDSSLFKERRLIYLALVGVVLALTAALFQSPINGTHRWIVTPWFHMQPSEFAKPVLILFVASYLARREERINELTTTVLPILCVVVLVGGLIILGRDFGTASMLIVVCAAMLFAAGISWRLIGLFSAAFIPAAAALMFGAAYRRDRLFAFLNPEADPLGKGFQALQSLIALGTGGLQGLGIGNGRQKLFFLPEPHTDFIFSIIGEELGFVGASLLVCAFGFFTWRGLRIAQRADDRFVFYAALGLTLMIAVQALINFSVALCLLPTKGIALPLVSYGGSSLIASLIAIGILLNLSQQTN